MRSKEIQEKLNITVDRIKYYKREGVFFPQNKGVNSKITNYTEVDLENLRFLIVLTKLGFTCSDIRKLQKGEQTLQEVGNMRKQLIEEDIEMKQSSLELLSNLLDTEVDFNTLDVNLYYNIISTKEASGETFIDIEDYSISFMRNIKCIHCGIDSEVDLEEYIYADSSFEKENGMGPDRVYDLDSCTNYECPECDEKMRIHGWIREYPIGCYDSENIAVEKVEE